MEIKTVGIAGLGSVGAMYGSFLAKALGSGNVCGIADKERIERYRRDGIYLNGERLSFTYSAPEEVQPVDLLIFATKYYGLESALESARKACGRHTVVMSFLNGVTSEEMIAAYLHPSCLLYTTVQGMDSGKIGNRITMEHSGYVAFGRKDGTQDEETQAVEELFNKAGISFRRPKDIMRQLYSKWMLNCGVNQTCAYYETGYRGVQEPGKIRDDYLGAMREARMCANAEGIDLTEEDIRSWDEVISTLNPEGEPSMRQDTKAGRRTEVGLFAGTVCEIANRHSLQVPLNRMYLRKFQDAGRPAEDTQTVPES